MKYELSDEVATICIDDGKANVVSHQFIDDFNRHLDQAKSEAKVVVLTGRSGMFSAGFDLKEFQKGPDNMMALAKRGMALLTEVYSHPQPVVSVCDGHAVGLGAFLLLASDVRIGTDSDYNVTLPETAIGMGFTPVLMALIRDRISSRYQNLAVLQSKPFSGQEALQAGFLDQVVTQNQLSESVIETAKKLAELPAEAYARNKLDLRSPSLQLMKDFVEESEKVAA
ncbi:MAG: crotonase/enoyl-CoA hydratase family protein [Pseudomonadota bacterium]